MASLHHLIFSTSGSGSACDSLNGGSTSSGPADDYAFFRSFVAAQAARDPELAKLLELQQCQPDLALTHAWQQPGLQHAPAGIDFGVCDGQQQQQPCSAGSGMSHVSSGTNQACAEMTTCQLHCMAHTSQQQQQQQQSASKAVPLHDKGVDANNIVVHVVAAADSPTAHQAAQLAVQQQEKETAAAAAASGGMKAAPSTAAAAAAGFAGLSALKPDFSRSQIKSVRRLFPINSPEVQAAAIQGEYQLLDLLGKGAFGAAYKAQHLRTGKLVCIKTVEASTTAAAAVVGHSQAGMEQQKREVAVLAALQHPDIIRYHSCFSDGAKLHMVMEWADRGDLHTLLQQHAKSGTHLAQDQLLTYFVQLVAALVHTHAAGVMHRDLNTNNIFITSQGLLKIGDFGIAKVLGAQGARSSSGSGSGSSNNLSSSGAAGAVAAANAGPMAQSFVGTPNYLAPEQLVCGSYNQKADIWALGCVLYEMAALRPAFKADRVPLIYRLIKRGRTAPLPAIYSAELRALQQQLMAHDALARPSSAELLQHELLKPYLEQYKQRLQQLGLQLPQLPQAVCSSSNSGGNLLGCGMPNYAQSSNTGSSTERLSYLTLQLASDANTEHEMTARSSDPSVQGLQPAHLAAQSSQTSGSSSFSSAMPAAAAAEAAVAEVQQQQTVQCNSAGLQLEQVNLVKLHVPSHYVRCEELRQQQQQHCSATGNLLSSKAAQGSGRLVILCKCLVARLCICSKHHADASSTVDSPDLLCSQATATSSSAAEAAISSSGRLTTSQEGNSHSTAAAAADEEGSSSAQSDNAQEPLDRPTPLLFDEARLLPPPRHTLSTVPSSNSSTVFGSNVGSGMSSSFGSTLGSFPGAAQGSTPGYSGSVPASLKAGSANNIPSSKNLISSSLSSSSSSELAMAAQPSNSSSSSSAWPAAGPSHWSAMCTAAGLVAPANAGADETAAQNPAAAQTSQAYSAQQQQQQRHQHQQQQHMAKQQHALQPHQLQHMHMLAAHYTVQQQLCPELSGLSTISERSESRTTPRAGSSLVHSRVHSFTSNFTVNDNELAVSPLGHGCDHQDAFSPRAGGGPHAVQAVQQIGEAVQAVQSVEATQPGGAFEFATLATGAGAWTASPAVSEHAGAAGLLQAAHTSCLNGVASHRLAGVATVSLAVDAPGTSDCPTGCNSLLVPQAVADATMENAGQAGVVAMIHSCADAEDAFVDTAGSSQDVVVQQQQQQGLHLEPSALRDEQLMMQLALRKLHVNLCHTPCRSASASPASWGSSDSIRSTDH